VNGGFSINNDIAGSSLQHPSIARRARALQFALKQNALKQLAAPFPSAALFFHRIPRVKPFENVTLAIHVAPFDM
jgi:hypothetical protein